MQDKSPFQVYPKRSFQMNTEFSGFSQPSWTDSHTRCAGCKYLQTWSIIYPYFNQRMNPFSFHKTEDMHTNKISFIFKVWPKGVWLQLGTKVTPPTVPQKPMHTPGTCSSTLNTTQTTTCLTLPAKPPAPPQPASRKQGRAQAIERGRSSRAPRVTGGHFSGRDEACETDTPPADGQTHVETRRARVDVEVKKGWKEGTRITFPKEGHQMLGHAPNDLAFLSRRRSTPISDETARILCTPPPSRCERWDVYVCVRVYVCMVVRNVP